MTIESKQGKGLLSKIKQAAMQRLWRLSVCDPSIMAHCPKAEKVGYALTGLCILAFIVVSIFSGIYLSTLIFQSLPVAIVLGAGLALNMLIVFQLALTSVSSARLPHTAHFRYSWSSTGVRFIYLGFILLLVSKPLELCLWQHQIGRDLVKFKAKQVQLFKTQNLSFINKEIEKLQIDIQHLGVFILQSQNQAESWGNSLNQQFKPKLALSNLSTLVKVKKAKEIALQELKAKKAIYIQKFWKANQESNYLIQRVRILHSNYPATWGITVLLGLFLFFPFAYRVINVNKHVYPIKCDSLDYNLVLRSYHNFKQVYARVFLHKFSKQVVFHEPYLDPPFNTLRKFDTRTTQGKEALIAWIVKEKGTP